MKYVASFFIVMASLLLSGCQSSGTNHKKITLMGTEIDTQVQQGVNPNSLAYISKDKQEERKNKVAISKIEAEAKVEIERIKSQNQLSIAQLQAQTQKKIAESNLKTKVVTSKLDASTKKETMQYTVYIVIAVMVVVLIGLYLLYLNGKKNRELQKKMHEDKLKHEQFLKEKELEELRLHKILELAARGKLPKKIQEEVILSISKPQETIIHEEG